MIRIISKNSQPRTAATKVGYQPFHNEPTEVQADDDGAFVRVPAEAFAGGPVVLHAFDDSPAGIAEETNTLVHEVGELAGEGVRFLRNRPKRDEDIDPDQDAA